MRFTLLVGLADSRLSYVHASCLDTLQQKDEIKASLSGSFTRAYIQQVVRPTFAAPLLAEYSIVSHTFIGPQGTEMFIYPCLSLRIR